MNRQPTTPRGQGRAQSERRLVMVGGNGGMAARYREIAEERGWQLSFYEKHMPAGVRRAMGNVSLVIVVVTMISHPLRQQVVDAIGHETRIVYLKSASVSALRDAIPNSVPSNPLRGGATRLLPLGASRAA